MTSHLSDLRIHVEMISAVSSKQVSKAMHEQAARTIEGNRMSERGPRQNGRSS